MVSRRERKGLTQRTLRLKADISIVNKKQNVLITFLGNAYHDSRVVNLIDSLSAMNYDVKTISFDWKTEGFKTQIGVTSVYKLDKSKSSVLFYLNFFFLLVKYLLKHKAHYYFAEDIYTLPVVYFFAKKIMQKYFTIAEKFMHTLPD